MPADKVSRKFHLQNIKEWLALANTPICKSQEATAEALKEHCEMADTSAMINMSDIAHAVNTALVWVMHAQDLAGVLLGEIEAAPVAALHNKAAHPFPLYCDLCEAGYDFDRGVKPGDTCPCCDEGEIAVAIPF